MLKPHSLTISQLDKSFASTPILRDVNLQLMGGQSMALIGESGSGKSTLLNIIAGLDTADAGSVVLGDIDISSASVALRAKLRASNIGFVFQAFHLLPYLSAQKNIMLPLLLQNIPKEEAVARTLHLMRALNIVDRADALPSHLSGGEQQRVALARAVIHKPQLVLADEPTGNLDPKTASVALELLMNFVKDNGASLLMVTHSASVARQAEHTVRIVNCTIVQES